MKIQPRFKIQYPMKNRYKSKGILQFKQYLICVITQILQILNKSA